MVVPVCFLQSLERRGEERGIDPASKVWVPIWVDGGIILMIRERLKKNKAWCRNKGQAPCLDLQELDCLRGCPAHDGCPGGVTYKGQSLSSLEGMEFKGF